MKKLIIIIIIILAVLLIVGILYYFLFINNERFVFQPTVSVSIPAQENILVDLPNIEPESITTSNFSPPLARAGERVTKKPFGIYITPKNSPVQPEIFQGYHTGADFEIFPEELNIDVSARAICSGSIAVKKYASGYGGVLVQNCQLNKQPITVIYGHLDLASITRNSGEHLDQGSIIGNLGKGYSVQTDGERKHLHLGIHDGSVGNIRGYVDSQKELSEWIDPCLYVCPN